MSAVMKTKPTKVQKNSVALAEAIARTYEIRRMMKILEAEAKSLRPVIESNMGEINVMILGEFSVTRDFRERRDLDKEMLKAWLGDSYSKFETVFPYVVFDIKKVRQ